MKKIVTIIAGVFALVSIGVLALALLCIPTIQSTPVFQVSAVGFMAVLALSLVALNSHE